MLFYRSRRPKAGRAVATLLLLALAAAGAACGPGGRPPVDMPDVNLDVNRTDMGAPDVPTDAGCTDGSANCAMSCVDLQSDPHHCGSCATDCTTLPNVIADRVTCVAGRCEFNDACLPGRAHCSNNATDGCEVQLSSATNCGGCNVRCPNERPMCALQNPGADAGAPEYACSTGCTTAQPDRCGTTCFNLQTDRDNCGMCGNRCSAPANAAATCTAGVCGFTCNPNRGDCDGNPTNGCETDLTNTVANCGMCGNACVGSTGGGAACRSSVCALNCNAGLADCDDNIANGCETGITSNINNCGTCGTICMAATNAAPACRTGVCGLSCNAGWGDCDSSAANGCETDTAGNVDNCGACMNRCPARPNATATCSTGTCGILCNAGFEDCDGNAANGCEVALNTSAANCGMCRRACPTPTNATATCAMGACGFTCNPGFEDCDGNPANGCEVNLRTDPNNCGMCANECLGATNATPVCTGGVCGITCITDYANCDSNMANGCEANVRISPSNCGTCGTVCPSYPFAEAACTNRICGMRCNVGRFDCDGMTSSGCESPIMCP